MGKRISDAEIIAKIMTAVKENGNSMSIALGYKNPRSIYAILGGENKISTNMANKIVDVFPQVNYLFVTRGELPILIDQSKAIGQQHILGFSKESPKLEDVPQLLSDILKELKSISNKLDQ